MDAKIEAVAKALAWAWLGNDDQPRFIEDAQAIMGCSTVEEIARTLCKRNGNCFAYDDGRDLCPRPSDCRDFKSFRTEAEAAYNARESHLR